MTVLATKSNSQALLQNDRARVTKGNSYLLLQRAIEVKKTNANVLLVKLADIQFTKIGRVYPFSLGGGIWAMPFYFKPKGF